MLIYVAKSRAEGGETGGVHIGVGRIEEATEVRPKASRIKTSRKREEAHVSGVFHRVQWSYISSYLPRLSPKLLDHLQHAEGSLKAA